MTSLRERKKARTKAAIQHHALRLFREQGYAETTVEQIADAAEVSPSTFFRYFATKDETVLTDLFDSGLFQIMLTAPAELAPLQALEYAVRLTFEDLTDEQLQLEITRNELIASVPELRRGAMAEITRPVELVAEATATRLGRPLDDPDIRMWAGAVVGVLMTRTSSSSFVNDPRAAGTSLADMVGRLDRVIRLPDA